MKKNMLSVIAIILGLGLAVLSYILLPETVTTQLSVAEGDATTMPKLAAIIIPTLLCLGGAVGAIVKTGERAAKQKFLLISLVGVAVFAIMLAVNL